MYLRRNRRIKDGKEHCYWNIVESKRCSGGKVVQRVILFGKARLAEAEKLYAEAAKCAPADAMQKLDAEHAREEAEG